MKCEQCGYTDSIMQMWDENLKRARQLCLMCYVLSYTPSGVHFTREEWEDDL